MNGTERFEARWDVVGVGANSLDYVYVLPTAPAVIGPASKLRITNHMRSCGGQTATMLATCSALGLRTSYIGVFGHDDNGDRMREAISGRGVDLAQAVIRDAPNAYAVILIDGSTGERIVLWDRDPRLSLRPAEIAVGIASARLLHVDDVDPRAALAASRIAREYQVPVTSDIERIDEHTGELVELVTHPIFADHCVTQLMGVDAADVEGALRKLRIRHGGWLTVTLGARGCVALEGDRLLRIPGVPVRALDTTGAGDVFRGAFAYGVLQGWPAGQVLRFANAAAAASCLRPGAINSVPDRVAVDMLLGERGTP